MDCRTSGITAVSGPAGHLQAAVQLELADEPLELEPVHARGLGRLRYVEAMTLEESRHERPVHLGDRLVAEPLEVRVGFRYDL